MSDESTPFILGDAAIDATSEGRRGLQKRRRKKPGAARVLTHCENCGAPLTGEYCANCGQHAVDYKRSLWRVLIDAADSFFNWDTKFFASLGVLLTRPWKLTNDFNAGRRARYVHPLRLYLLASIGFFLVVKLVNINNTEVLQFDASDRAEIVSALSKLTGQDSTLTSEQQATIESLRSRMAQPDGALNQQEKDALRETVSVALATKMKDKFEKRDRARLKAALRKIPEMPTPRTSAEATKTAEAATEAADEVRREVAAELATQGAVPPPVPPLPENGISPMPGPAGASPLEKPHRTPGLHVGPDNRPQKPIESWLENRLKSKVGENGTKAKLFLETLRNNIPTMMLCCIPLFALVLKMLYLGRRRYYVEHLVYALHIHTFVYVGATLVTLLALAVAQVSETFRVLLSVALGILLFVQVFVSIRRVYGQGWFATTCKFLLGGIFYAFILICAVGVTAFVTILLPD